MSDQQALLSRAARLFPGGVLGSHRSGSELEFVVREARGPHLWDAAGRRYIDYLLGSGPMLLGHAHPAVVEAVQRQVGRGTTFMLLNEPIIELADEIVRAVPCAEQVRFTSSGSEATFFALRVARALRTGAIGVNSNSSVFPQAPFGGYKASGIGKELGMEGLVHNTELKSVFISTE